MRLILYFVGRKKAPTIILPMNKAAESLLFIRNRQRYLRAPGERPRKVESTKSCMTKRRILLLYAVALLCLSSSVQAESLVQDSSRANAEAFKVLLPAPFGILAGVWAANAELPYPAPDVRSALPAVAANGPALHALLSALPSREAVFTTYLQRLARDYESRHIMYRSIPLSDCSGMFHRLLQQMKEAFPAFTCPEVAEARSSRALAQWYYNRGALHIVEDPAGSGPLIRPGAILFFGQPGKKYPNPTIGQLATYGEGIMHIGTVVDVEKDEQGGVIGYTMFHARGRGKPASHTRHYLRHPGNPALSPFGNWRQPLVAVAYIDTLQDKEGVKE